MYSELILTLLSLSVNAVPLADARPDQLQARDDDTFNLHILNNCPADRQFALYSIGSDFSMKQMSDSVKIGTNETGTICAPYHATGMRLSPNADWSLGDQWKPQSLFEFGYSKMNNVEGTAYDISMMDGCDKAIGMAAWPIVDDADDDACPSKVCTQGSCDKSQGWSNPNQVEKINGNSAADTVCYKGKKDFVVIVCPGPDDKGRSSHKNQDWSNTSQHQAHSVHHNKRHGHGHGHAHAHDHRS
ncbi:hypothetical protein K470DRAFT_215353 [Piedraia hortae CBS 480.64]|uniref:Osmotin, thaumatin-like protein n=1 Tax=Piedraia hortae CBS 480.64 TaxID=1314780 RepID=A0A6A7C196_9PEZI|nr:hypothetical protein K470DRAFT_215353 [Piedraia hortae CBS 480.64]